MKCRWDLYNIEAFRMPSNTNMQVIKNGEGWLVAWFERGAKALIETHAPCWKMHDFDFSYHENAI